MCPPCIWLQIERWLQQQKARLLACEHDHVIFTMPDERRGLWLANNRPRTQLLCATVRETLGELLGDAKYLGAQAGIIAALHTWRQALGDLVHRGVLGRFQHVIDQDQPEGDVAGLELQRYRGLRCHASGIDGEGAV